MSYIVGKNPCKKCRENGGDNSGDNFHWYGEGLGGYCHSCGFTIPSDDWLKENGKEIYEGDLLRREIKTPWMDEPNVFYEECIFDVASFKCKSTNEKDKRSPMFLGNSLWHSIEIIGNIHENPELL